MSVVTTTREQNNAARLARRVGGYSELIRLAAERGRIAGAVRIERDQNGRLTILAVGNRQPVGPSDR